jgi:hypothetical protein
VSRGVWSATKKTSVLFEKTAKLLWSQRPWSWRLRMKLAPTHEVGAYALCRRKLAPTRVLKNCPLGSI